MAVGGLRLTSAGATSPLPRISFIGGEDGSLLVHGTYPTISTVCVRHTQPILHARFTGTVEVGKTSDGKLFVIGQLPFEDYLRGIAEVPRTWPMEALKAQAVAARSYAIAHMSYPDPTGAALGYQLCATDACQVYRGLGVADGPYGNRWRAAVDQTAGQVLLYGGRPADTLYFSTSNGHTVPNDQVFGTAPVPYLRSVTENDDGGSPLSHWGVQIPLGDLTRFLEASGDWSSGPITAVRTSGTGVIVAGKEKGALKTLDLSGFRNEVNYWSHCLDPSSYPGTNTSNGTGLPQSIPSKWFSMSTQGTTAVLTGRGWGHGVGMVQWGAEGKAARGLSYQQILEAYYGGLRPQGFAEPSQIRVGIAVGLQSVEVAPNGPVTVSGAEVERGPWVLTGGSKLRISRIGALPRYITAGRLTAPPHAQVGRRFQATLVLPQLSVVRLVVRAGGSDVALTRSTTYQPGTVPITGSVPKSLPSGSYPIQAIVSDGIDIVRTGSGRVVVSGGPSPSPSPSPGPPSPSPKPPPAALAARSGSRAPLAIALGSAGLVVLGAAGAIILLRRRRRPGTERSGKPIPASTPGDTTPPGGS